MRKLVALLSMLVAVPAVAADMWRWRDADGVVHYSDRPMPGAEKISIETAERSPQPQTQTSSQPQTAPRPPAAEPPPPRYVRCAFMRPSNDEVFNSVNAVTATVALEPALQNGHRLVVYVNGAEYPAWPAGVQTYTLQELNRGSYTLNARVVDAQGNAHCSGPATTFHIRQPTLLSPARRPVPTPRTGG